MNLGRIIIDLCEEGDWGILLSFGGINDGKVVKIEEVNIFMESSSYDVYDVYFNLNTIDFKSKNL